MAACTEKEDDDREAMTTILRMLLSAGGTEELGDEDGLRLSQLIDRTCREVFSGGRGLQSPVDVRNHDVTAALLAVLHECVLSHRWTAALRVLASVAHRLPKRYGRTVLCCVLELCAQLSLPTPDSLMLQLKTYAELTEHEVAVEWFMSRAAAGEQLAACRAALAPLPRRRHVPGRDDRRHRLLVRAYDGLASYAQYLDARRTLDHDDGGGDLADDARHEASARMTSCARDALEKWDGLVDVPGVWDLFVVKQVELLESAGELDAAEDVLSRYAGHTDPAVWPNAVQLLYSFYERHPHPGDDRRRAALEQLCALVPSHPLTLTLYRQRVLDAPDCVDLLFGLLDYASWRDDVRPWRLLARHLSACCDPAATAAVRRAWSVRRDWWPAYHFVHPAASSLPPASPLEETVSLIGYKASVAYLLVSADNAYTQTALSLDERTAFKTKGMAQLKKIVEKGSTLPVDS